MPASRRDIGHQTNLELRQRVFYLQLTLFHAPKREVVDTQLFGKAVNRGVQVTMFNLQLDNAPLYFFLIHRFATIRQGLGKRLS